MSRIQSSAQWLFSDSNRESLMQSFLISVRESPMVQKVGGSAERYKVGVRSKRARGEGKMLRYYCTYCTMILCAMVGSVGCDRLGKAEAATAALSTGSLETIVGPGIDREQEGGTRATVQERVQTGNPLWAIPLSTLSVTRERPIFSPSRRPPPPPSVATAVYIPPPTPAPAEPDHPLLTLLGTIVGETDRIGIFLDQATQSVVRLKTGQDHAGWVLLSVEGRMVRFEKGSRAATLSLPARGAEQERATTLPSPDNVARPLAVAPLAPPAQPANRRLDREGRNRAIATTRTTGGLSP
jgi:general secretion pathway protein N